MQWRNCKKSRKERKKYLQKSWLNSNPKTSFWKEYCSLGSGDDKKNDTLEPFSLDKTCSKVVWRSKALSQESFENNSGCDGWISRFLAAFQFCLKCSIDTVFSVKKLLGNLGFEVAKEEGSDVQNATLLQSILAQLPQDQNWDTNIPRVKALLEAKEMRYFYQKKNLRVSGSA